ncbi:2'-5' RNA ligase [Variovorax sp. HW608]|uniref:RNA 2',3'-cyclic phosphodiesterase n=1 Tax=Variovorax sp. HW608 TaxID=1034889 RepID=UPI00081FD165|nr:RNA 2',3'-cyclic phosphodiesterase [Variovorax sp. HW608]SCK51979.1 2'-5' RNA ligase [Variovorax sp. HW608]
MNALHESTRRLFIGLFPGPAVRAAIEAHRKTWAWPAGVRLTNGARIHMTLHFLGPVERAREPPLAQCLADVRMRGMTLLLRTPEAWRNPIAVLMPDEHEGLRALHEGIVRQVERAGFVVPPERWVPHLTLARRTRGAVPPGGMAPIAWQVNEFVLVCSHTAYPSRYEFIAHYPAKG